jgi:predicted Fe-S protein YdhL (DUF1289 family)
VDATDEPVASPCVSVCALDASGRTCTACRRTIDEIVGWAAMSDAARRAVLARVRDAN